MPVPGRKGARPASRPAMTISALPSSILSKPEPEPASASGRLRLGRSDRTAARVDLVWRDPQTGARLALDLEVCPEMLAGLRDAGFEVQAGPFTDPEDARDA